MTDRSQQYPAKGVRDRGQFAVECTQGLVPQRGCEKSPETRSRGRVSRNKSDLVRLLKWMVAVAIRVALSK
jgi:hypothetical protein